MRDSVNSARRHALRLLKYRGRSERELSERLALKGFPPHVISETVRALREAGLVDDVSLARSLKEIAEDVKLLGRRGVVHFLRKRGIDESLIEELGCEDSDEFDRALRLVERKRGFLQGHPPEKQAKRIEGFLMRRGYSFETVRRVVRELFHRDEGTNP